MGYLHYAKNEFKLLGYEELKPSRFKFIDFVIDKLSYCVKKLKEFNRHKYEDDNPNIWIQENVLELLEVFSDQGHSGSSAPFCVSYFKKLALFKNLSPLTGEDDEWSEVSDGVFQNKRLTSVFRQSDRFNGQAYDINGKVFWEWSEMDLSMEEEGYPGKRKYRSYYTSIDSFIPIKFPYIPPEEPIYEYRES